MILTVEYGKPYLDKRVNPPWTVRERRRVGKDTYVNFYRFQNENEADIFIKTKVAGYAQVGLAV